MKRVFLAIPAGDDPAIREHYDGIRSFLRDEKVRWVRPENLHLTLHFFGEMEEEAIARADCLFREHLRSIASFALDFRGVGVFPSVHKPRVLWFGVRMPGVLETLVQAVGEVLREGGFPLPGKPFSPHLTLGRIKWIGERRRFEQLLGEKKDAEITRLPVPEVHFIESILKPEGPEYKVMQRYVLER